MKSLQAISQLHRSYIQVSKSGPYVRRREWIVKIATEKRRCWNITGCSLQTGRQWDVWALHLEGLFFTRPV